MQAADPIVGLRSAQLERRCIQVRPRPECLDRTFVRARVCAALAYQRALMRRIARIVPQPSIPGVKQALFCLWAISISKTSSDFIIRN
jgi:hypothetical protein